MNRLLELLKGKKTYFLAALGALWALTGFLLGHLDAQTASEVLWASLTAAALRNGLPAQK